MTQLCTGCIICPEMNRLSYLHYFLVLRHTHTHTHRHMRGFLCLLIESAAFVCVCEFVFDQSQKDRLFWDQLHCGIQSAISFQAGEEKKEYSSQSQSKTHTHSLTHTHTHSLTHTHTQTWLAGFVDSTK